MPDFSNYLVQLTASSHPINNWLLKPVPPYIYFSFDNHSDEIHNMEEKLSLLPLHHYFKAHGCTSKLVTNFCGELSHDLKYFHLRGFYHMIDEHKRTKEVWRSKNFPFLPSSWYISLSTPLKGMPTKCWEVYWRTPMALTMILIGNNTTVLSEGFEERSLECECSKVLPYRISFSVVWN